MTEEDCLRPGRFVDSDHPRVVEFARAHAAGGAEARTTVLDLYYAIRDGIRYDPYGAMGDPATYRASDAVIEGHGFCIPKSALLAACCRVHGIPARPGYADVRNHLATPRMIEKMGTDLFYWHSYCETLIEGTWVKSTPAFNKSLCDRFGLKPLEFDGRTDSLFHEFDRVGNRHMEYLLDRGPFVDVPFETILADFKKYYGNIWMDGMGGDFDAETAEAAAADDAAAE
jgi:transglutaminase-like putative cysteine protease